LFTPSSFRDLVSGRRRGLWAAVLRGVFRILEVPYTWAGRWRNRRYDTGKAETCRVGVPVVSVGNLTLGGTGKTPMVEWLVRWFQERDTRPVIVSRGYGSKKGSQNDEALELAQRLPGVPHLQNPNRVAAAQEAIAAHDCQVIVLDDAFQHRRIARDLDIVLLDALEPFGFGHVFPRGTLREPIAGLQRAGIVALSRADLLEPPERAEIREQVEKLAPNALWMEVAHTAKALISASGRQEPLDSLAGKPVAAFCGLGNPAGFRHTLEACGYELAGFCEFPDHHIYCEPDLVALAKWVQSLDVEALLCTGKDLVKFDLDELGYRPLWALTVGLEILAGREELEGRLDSLLQGIR